MNNKKIKDPISELTKSIKASNEANILAPEKPLRNSQEMRAYLIGGMRDVMAGKITTFQAKAACNFAQQIYNTSALEIRTALAKQKLGDGKIQSVSLE